MNLIDIAARQTDRNPTEAQKASGNYAKGKVRLHGLEIAIENPKGGKRAGVDKGGKAWSVTMPAHYGYVKGTEGSDGDHVDVYIGPKPDSDKVWVVDQIDAGSKRFDEHKVLLGYASKADAVSDYKRAFSDGKGSDRIGSVTELSVGAFKDWLRNGDTMKPMAKANTGLSRATGGRVGYAGGGAPFGGRMGLSADMLPYEAMEDDGPDVLAREPAPRRRGPNGFDGPEVTPGWREALGAMMNETADNPHIPAMGMGISNIVGGARALTDDDPSLLHKLAGLSQMITGGLTPASMIRPAAKVLDPLWNTWPRYAATYGTLGAPRAAEAVRDAMDERTERGYDGGGAVPLSDSGPLPGQDWPESYKPEGGAEFLRMLQEAGLGLSKAIAPPMPPLSREELRASIGQPKSLGEFAVEDGIPSAIAAFAPGLGRIPAVRSAGRYVLERPLGSLLTAAGLGTAGAVAASEASGEENKWDPETAKSPYSGPKRNSIETKGIQERAAAKGLYPGDKIDGIDSGGTRAAEWELIKRERKEAAELRRLDTETNTAATKAATDAEREKREGEERKTGLSQFEAAQKDPKNAPWITPNMGYGLGAGIGTGLGLGVSAIFDKRARALMQGANKLLEQVGAKGKAAGTLSERIGKVNDFARKGGAGEEVPFKRAATQDPPWKPNAKAMEASGLYPSRSMKAEYGTQGALVAGGLTESGVSMWMAKGAHERLKAAEDAVRDKPNPTTIAAYLDARNSANMWESLENVGRGWALTQATAAKLGPMAFGGDRRPDIAKYEGELGAVSKKLRADKKKVKEYEAQTAAEKAAKEQQKQERAAARAAKKKGVGPGAAGATLIGGSQLLGDRLEPEESALPISQELALPNSLETEGFRKRGGPVDKHHSHFQPRKTGRFAGGPVYPQHGGDADDSQDILDMMPSAMDYAAGGATGKGGGYPYYPPDYSGKGDPATNDLVFAERKKRDTGGRLVEEIEAPQPDYTYGRPRFPNLDPRAYFDGPSMSRYANEGDLSRAKEAGLSALPAAMIALRMRNREMGKVKEADAMRAMDRSWDEAGKFRFDPGVSGGNSNPYALGRRGTYYKDSSTELATRPGSTTDPFRAVTRDVRPANEPYPFDVIQGGMRNMGGPVGYDHGGVVTGPIVGDHGGRSDTRPVSVESGSFVIPADIVGYLGQGNSNAGFRVLEKQFGPARVSQAAANGGAVDIRISDGEYSLSPEQVAKVGGGNVEQGHALLDKMVLALRKQNVEQLRRLPPPAKS